MGTDELKKRLDDMAREYERCAFWDRYVAKCGEMIMEKVRGKVVCEMGCSTLVVSKMLAGVSKRFEIVEGSESFAGRAREYFGDSVAVHHSLFEDFSPSGRYDAIVLTNTLHHLANPREIMLRMRQWLDPEGVVYVTVPNMLSLHRRIGVKMGLLPDVFATTDRNRTFDQSGRYTRETLNELCVSCGYRVRESFGFFLKPFSDEQMALLNPSDRLIDALFELGREFEEMASLLYVELILEHEFQDPLNQA